MVFGDVLLVSAVSRVVVVRYMVLGSVMLGIGVSRAIVSGTVALVGLDDSSMVSGVIRGHHVDAKELCTLCGRGS